MHELSAYIILLGVADTHLGHPLQEQTAFGHLACYLLTWCAINTAPAPMSRAPLCRSSVQHAVQGPMRSHGGVLELGKGTRHSATVETSHAAEAASRGTLR